MTFDLHVCRHAHYLDHPRSCSKVKVVGKITGRKKCYQSGGATLSEEFPVTIMN